MNTDCLTILVVDDDIVDVEIVERGTKKRNLDHELMSMQDGRQALEFLRSDSLSEEQRERLAIVLDINMPCMNGHQFLEELRNDPRPPRTVVFVLSTSDHVRDKSKAYDKNVAGYFTKPNIESLLNTLELYAHYGEFPPWPAPAKP